MTESAAAFKPLRKFKLVVLGEQSGEYFNLICHRYVDNFVAQLETDVSWRLDTLVQMNCVLISVCGYCCCFFLVYALFLQWARHRSSLDLCMILSTIPTRSGSSSPRRIYLGD